MNKIPENTPNLYDQKQTITRMLQKHLRVLDLHLAGKTDVEIGELTGIGARRIKKIRNSPTFEHELSRRRKQIENKYDDAAIAVAVTKTDAQQVLDDESVNAAQELVEGLLSDDDGVRFKSAESILDRTGYGKQTKVDTRNATVTTNIPAETMKTVLDTLKMIQTK
jgi:hypothetical protein